MAVTKLSLLVVSLLFPLLSLGQSVVSDSLIVIKKDGVTIYKQGNTTWGHYFGNCTINQLDRVRVHADGSYTVITYDPHLPATEVLYSADSMAIRGVSFDGGEQLFELECEGDSCSVYLQDSLIERIPQLAVPVHLELMSDKERYFEWLERTRYLRSNE